MDWALFIIIIIFIFGFSRFCDWIEYGGNPQGESSYIRKQKKLEENSKKFKDFNEDIKDRNDSEYVKSLKKRSK